MKTDQLSAGIVASLDTLRHFALQNLSMGRNLTKQMLHSQQSALIQTMNLTQISDSDE